MKKRRINYNINYIKYRQEAFRRRYLTGFSGLVMDAAQGKIEPLLDYLDSEKPLYATDRELLAWLIRRWQQRGGLRKRGRPPGRTAGDKQLAAAQFIAFKVSQDNNDWCAKNKRKRAPKGRVADLIPFYIEQYRKRPGVSRLDPAYVLTQLKGVSRK
jgi:hypothetical protein